MEEGHDDGFQVVSRLMMVPLGIIHVPDWMEEYPEPEMHGIYVHTNPQDQLELVNGINCLRRYQKEGREAAMVIIEPFNLSEDQVKERYWGLRRMTEEWLKREQNGEVTNG